MGVVSDMKETRKSPEFKKLQEEAREALEKMDDVMIRLNKAFPLRDGFWTVRANGALGISFHYPDH